MTIRSIAVHPFSPTYRVVSSEICELGNRANCGHLRRRPCITRREGGRHKVDTKQRRPKDQATQVALVSTEAPGLSWITELTGRLFPVHCRS